MINYIRYNCKVGVYMKTKNSKKSYFIFLLVLSALGGTIIGEILGSKVKALDFLKVTYTLGTPKNLAIDLKFLSFSLGLNLYINLMTIIGIFLAIIIYKKH